MNNNTGPIDDEFFTAIGRLTISFAVIEFGLDAAISVIHQRLQGDTIDPEVPIHIGRKVKYLRRCFKRLAPLLPHQETALKTIQRIADVAKFRNHIMHGIVVHHAIGSEEVKLVRLLHDKGGQHTEKSFNISTKTINKAVSETKKLAAASLKLAQAMAEISLRK